MKNPGVGGFHGKISFCGYNHIFAALIIVYCAQKNKEGVNI